MTVLSSSQIFQHLLQMQFMVGTIIQAIPWKVSLLFVALLSKDEYVPLPLQIFFYSFSEENLKNTFLYRLLSLMQIVFLWLVPAICLMLFFVFNLHLIAFSCLMYLYGFLGSVKNSNTTHPESQFDMNYNLISHCFIEQATCIHAE